MMFETSSLQLFVQSLPLLAKGALVTLQLAIVGILIGFCGGLLCGILNSKKLRQPVLGYAIDLFVWTIRGTPLFVQLLIVYYALPEVIGISLSPFTAGVVALGINSMAYVSEIVRGGIDAIPTQQWDAAHVLGYSRRQTVQNVILPQMLRQVLPSLTNELTTLIKETSILMVIGVAELTKVSKDIVARELDPMTIYLGAALLYLALTSGISWLAKIVQPGGSHA